MVTGDHLLTAHAIATECNVLGNDRVAITGAQLRKMPPTQLSEMLPSIAVVARSTPSDKHLLVTALREAGHIVAVTGDGTNDVPALIAADVGLSMGRCGTELAKEASDIVVLDDDFRSIVRAVVWGRCVYNNIRRFLQFQLTTNVSTLFISFVSAVLLEETPFKAVQLLWVNLIMDSLGALALATGKPRDALLHQSPNRKEMPLISRFMILNIAGQALVQICLIGLILIFPCGLKPHSQHHYTLLYNVFVLCQMFNLVNARSTGGHDDPTIGFFDTPLFFGILIGVGVVQFMLVQLAGPLFSCTPLNPREWLVSVGLAGLTLPAGFLIRRIPIGTDSWKYQVEREDNQRLLT
jgi:Ca2+-transporting ATPase